MDKRLKLRRSSKHSEHAHGRLRNLVAALSNTADGELLAGGDRGSGLRLGGLAHSVCLVDADDLDVGGAAHVRVDATVSAVRPAAHVGGVVDLDVLDHELVNLEGAVLTVGDGVLEQVNEHAGGLLRPATLGARGLLATGEVLGLQF